MSDYPAEYNQAQKALHDYYIFRATIHTNTPIEYESWPSNLQKAWIEVRDALEIKRQNPHGPRTIQQAIRAVYEKKVEHFRTVYMMWLNDNCTCKPDGDACASCKEILNKQDIPY